MDIRLSKDFGPETPRIVNLRCPICGHLGAFHGLAKISDLRWLVHSGRGPGVTPFSAGLRVCPNNDCKALVFVIVNPKELLQTYPPEVIDFDSTNLPQPILQSLEEAIKCHAAGCYKASALMVRRVLEELCQAKNAQGADLKKRLAALGKTIVIPQELLAAADELRILGNDAAHVEARVYDNIGPDEAELAIELANELLKAAYQYTALVGRLKGLAKPATS